MVDFLKENTKSGKLFKHPGTEEICKIICWDQHSINLRPLNYKGLMSYTVTYGTPFEKEWKLVGEINEDE